MHLNFLHPHGPSRSYFFPQRCDTLHVHIRDTTSRSNHAKKVYMYGRVGHLGHDEAMEAGGLEFDPRPGHYSRMSF